MTKKPTALLTRSILLVWAIIVSPAASSAMTFSADLPELLGRVEFLPAIGFRDASFDFGQEFSEIESVSIEIEAEVSARRFDFCGTFLTPQACMPVVQLLGFVVQLDTEGFPIFSRQTSRGLLFGDVENLEGSGVATAEFSDQFIRSNFEYLHDGKGDLTLFWNDLLGNPDRIFINTIEPIGEIINARLIIEGTPVPEPSTAFLVGVGLVLLSGKKKIAC